MNKYSPHLTSPKGRGIKGFTLVELIVVITILAILGTIAFISLQGYSADARDSSRISDINHIKTSLELYSLAGGKYPIPDNSQDVTYSGGTVIVWKQGTVGDTVTSQLSRNLNQKPTDPKLNTEYIYSITPSKGEYELLSIYEGDIVGDKDLLMIDTYAASNTIRIDGTYNGLYVKNGEYIIPTPSIITSLEPTGLDLNQTTIKSQVINRGKNKPNLGRIEAQTGTLIFNDFQVYKGTLNSETSTGELLNAYNAIANTYNGSSLENIGVINTILSKTTDEEKIAITESIVLNNSSSVTTTVDSNDVQTFSCTGTVPSVNVTTSNDTGLTQDTVWQNTDNTGSCYFTCDTEYRFINGECRYDIENSPNLVLYHDYDFSYDDDFSTLDLNRWRDNSKEGTCSIIDGKLNMNYNGSTEWASCRLLSNKKLRGDFDIELDFSELNITAPNINSTALLLGSIGGNQRSYISRQVTNTNIHRYLVRYGLASENSNTNGKIRLTRSDSTVSGYFWNGNSWATNLGSTSSSFWSNTDDITIDLLLQKAGTLNQTINVNLDNFKVSKGEIMEDMSGNGNDGVLAYATSDTGKKGKALNFDGVDGHIVIEDSDDFAFGNENFTIDYWVKPTGFPNSYPRIIDYIDTANPATDRFTMNIMDNNGQKKIWFGVQINGVWEVSFSDPIDMNQWTHIAIVRNGNTWTLYKNGVNVQSTTSSITFPNFDSNFTIGDDSFTNGTRTFQGLIDELRIVKGKAIWTENFNPEEY